MFSVNDTEATQNTNRRWSCCARWFHDRNAALTQLNETQYYCRKSPQLNKKILSSHNHPDQDYTHVRPVQLWHHYAWARTRTAETELVLPFVCHIVTPTHTHTHTHKTFCLVLLYPCAQPQKTSQKLCCVFHICFPSLWQFHVWRISVWDRRSESHNEDDTNTEKGF